MIHPIKHFRLITRHRHQVIRHGAKCGIFWQTLGHDLSKYMPAEFVSGAKYFQGKRSPIEEERQRFGYSKTWLHHQGRNKHHFEYWWDYNPQTNLMEPVRMPFRYVAEMFCDRVAASKIYQGENYTEAHPIHYFLKDKGRHPMHPDTSREIEALLRMLAEKGEKETFREIKNRVRTSRRKY